MDAHTLMEDWEVSPFDGGFDGLRDLASRRFSGAVEAGGSWLFLRDGEPLAAVDDLEVDPRPGDVAAFEGASGRIHEATHPATAALAAMLALGGEVRGQYFTEDTPLSTVHDTLSEGGFTGYVELSENVLSGDYYVVYEEGDEDYLGVLGSSQRLITDDEAQSKAEGEVGIYSVVAVSLPDIELPEPESAPADDAGETVAAGPSDAADEPAESSGLEDPLDQSESESEPEPMPAADDGAAAVTEPDVETAATVEPEADADETAESKPESPGETAAPIPEEPEQEQETQAETAVEPESEPATTPERAPEPEPEPESEPEARSGPTPEPDDDESEERLEYPDVETNGESSAAGTGSSGSSEPELAGVTTRSVPSLDPERTGRAVSNSPDGSMEEPTAQPTKSQETTPRPESASGTQSDPEPVDEDRLEEVREETRREVSREYENRIEELQSELQSVREERDNLRQRVSNLESAASDGTASDGPMLSPAEALAGTSLFVREGTRGEATLEDAHAGRTDRETLANNLRIEYHTQFDDADATVDGEPFESWLRSSAPHEFVEWLIEDLLFEIQSTGSGAGLRHLYDALPEIDRIGFDDTVTVGDGEEGREVTFDVVARNRMGEPLVVADIDESRDPTRADSIRPLIGDTEDVCMDHETLAAAFSVTSSFFEPDALDAAREATSGSLLGRDKYRSFVKLARKNGFHLCLVESREESFHLSVPEL
ncbi:hypothetical protein HWV07_03570 [Natronomonas salina]|uniref:DUF7527 domain-containing protein n=1 Tax=Natronomonas salina TaxID=1710540 RepID=UPI0015B57344|nr:hypothetical protein [Natronomonas salina]QLD88162.1 hypothetical protein HWV07_03570 [Natronomonas salina]